MTEQQARQKILDKYLQSVGAIELKQAARLFRWEPAVCQIATQGLVEEGLCVVDVQLEGKEEKLIANVEFVCG